MSKDLAGISLTLQKLLGYNDGCVPEEVQEKLTRIVEQHVFLEIERHVNALKAIRTRLDNGDVEFFEQLTGCGKMHVIQLSYLLEVPIERHIFEWKCCSGWLPPKKDSTFHNKKN